MLVVPRPKRVRERQGAFAISGDEPIVLAPGHSGSDHFAASQLADEIARCVGRRPPVEAHARLNGLGPCIVLAQFDRDEALVPLKPPRESIGEEGYVVEVGARRVVAAARTDAGLFYAVQTLRQAIEPRGRAARIPAVRIVDWPDFRYRGVMHDISRFKVPTLETLFALAERLAALKVNVLQLYTEHTFASRRHPDVSAGCDPLTPDDLMTLDAVCRALHIELQPNLQSFGHHEHLLSQPRYAHLAETADPRPWTLTPVREGTYRLLDDLYAEFLPCHASRLFNADCDETWDLGTGQSAARAKRIGLGRLYLGHIRRINDLAQKYGRRMMIWADIVQQHLDLIDDVPDDVILLDWQYGLDTRDGTSKAIAATGRLEHWVCPGTNGWSTLCAQVERARRNIRQMAEIGKATGATGLLNTDWGDGGHPNPLGVSFHGFAFGAEQAWHVGDVPPRAFDRRFAWAWFRDRSGRFGRLYRLLGRTNDAFGLGRWQGMPFRLFWDRFPDGERLHEAKPADVSRCRADAERALALARDLRKAHPEHAVTLDECLLAARQTLLACRKHEVAADVRDAAGRPRATVRSSVRRLAAEWEDLRDEFERLWLARSRRSQIDYRLGLYRRGKREYLRVL